MLYGNSSRALELGHDLREALLRGSLDEAADRLALEATNTLSAITSDATRQSLRQRLASKLLKETRLALSDSTTGHP